MVISDELKGRLPLSLRSGEGVTMVIMTVLCVLLCSTVPIAIFLNVKSDIPLVGHVVSLLFPLLLLVTIGLPCLGYAISQWWKRNHDGYVMIITRVEHKMLNDDGPPDTIVYVSAYKRASEFRHVPSSAYDDAMLIALNPKRREIVFEGGVYFTLNTDFRVEETPGFGAFYATTGGMTFRLLDEKSAWKFLKENPFCTHLGSANDLVAFMSKQETKSRALLNVLKEAEERVADKKDFGRASGALVFRSWILSVLLCYHDDEKVLAEVRSAYDSVSKDIAVRDSRKTERKGSGGVWPYEPYPDGNR